jgi:hypothetical protein
MLHHERPYLDHPEQLEYPTETWAAHDLRKANVLRLASRHADEPLRTDLLRRGDELADRAMFDLMQFRRPDTARALAILMVEYGVNEFFHTCEPAPAPVPDGDHTFALPETFVPQRARIAARFSSARGMTMLRLLDVRRWHRYLSSRR